MTFTTYSQSQSVPSGLEVGLKCTPPPQGMTLTLAGQEGEKLAVFNAGTSGGVVLVDSQGANFGADGTYELPQSGQAAFLVYTGGQWWAMGEHV